MKQMYEAPEVRVIDMELQGVIAVSGPDDIEKQDWGS